MQSYAESDLPRKNHQYWGHDANILHIAISDILETYWVEYWQHIAERSANAHYPTFFPYIAKFLTEKR